MLRQEDEDGAAVGMAETVGVVAAEEGDNAAGAAAASGTKKAKPKAKPKAGTGGAAEGEGEGADGSDGADGAGGEPPLRRPKEAVTDPLLVREFVDQLVAPCVNEAAKALLAEVQPCDLCTSSDEPHSLPSLLSRRCSVSRSDSTCATH